MLASEYESNGFRQTDRQTTHSKHHFLEPLLQTLPLTGYVTDGALSFTVALSAGQSFTSSHKSGVVFGQRSQHRGGLSPEVSKEGWSFSMAVFASGLNIRVFFQQGGLSPEVSTQGWSFSNVVFRQQSQHRGGLSAGRSFASGLNTGVVFHQQSQHRSGLSAG